MKKKKIAAFLALILTLTVLTSCGGGQSTSSETDSTKTKAEASTGESTAVTTVDAELTEIMGDLKENENTLEVTVSEGTADCWTVSNKTLTFSGLTEDTTCTVSGAFDGQIVIDADDCKFKLEMDGLTLHTSEINPIDIVSGDKVTVSAVEGSKNYVYDLRVAVTSDDSHAAAVFADCDLDIKGKGELCVISTENNGIHSKDDLNVKNITMSVTCMNNALKGNDSVEIKSGEITLISKEGDGIKTTNSDVSDNGKQRGTVEISGGTVNIYAACDGICAAYDADISEEAVLNIYTDTYSSYSGDVEKEEESEGNGGRYIRFTYKDYSYSVKYYNSDSDYVWANATFYKSVSGGMSTYYYFAVDKIDGYDSVQIFMYSSDQEQGQEEDCVVSTDYMTWNDSYDTFALSARGNSLSYNWTNYSETVTDEGGFGGRGGGPGGMSDGNTEKGEYSTKGIKADNEIHISGGTVTVKSYDDALHASSGTELENGNTSTGNVLISGGTLNLYSKDDGIHADGDLTISGGEVNVTGSYEALEGTTVVISGGTTDLVSSDDGVNATTESGVGITFSGGSVNIFAGGDGVDSNSRTSYQGILFDGGDVTVVSTTSMNSSIDTEAGYTYKSGTVLAICPSNGMGNESLNCQNFSSVGTKTNMNLSENQTLTVTVGGSTATSLVMPASLSALVIYLGSAGANISAK